METVPMVTVVCIAFNHGPYISKTLDGFLLQRVDFPLEVIVHDDASTDGTADIVRSYAKEHPDLFIPILQSENQYSKGGKPGLNCFKRARGKYIAFCEGDDYWTDPLKLQKQVDHLEAHPECIACYHDAVVVDDQGRMLKPSKLPEHQKRDHSSEELMRGQIFVATLTLMFRNISGLFQNMPPEFYKVRNGDSFLMMLLGAHGSGHYMPEVKPAAYRVHGGGVWSSNAKLAQERIRISTLMWMAAYNTRIGRADIAEIMIDRVNRMIKAPYEWYGLKGRRSYHWYARVMRWFGVGLPR